MVKLYFGTVCECFVVMGSYLIENLLGLAKTPVYNDYHVPVEDGSAPIICRYHFLPLAYYCYHGNSVCYYCYHGNSVCY